MNSQLDRWRPLALAAALVQKSSNNTEFARASPGKSMRRRFRAANSNINDVRAPTTLETRHRFPQQLSVAE
jgi:hypothetical protein